MKYLGYATLFFLALCLTLVLVPSNEGFAANCYTCETCNIQPFACVESSPGSGHYRKREAPRNGSAPAESGLNISSQRCAEHCTGTAPGVCDSCSEIGTFTTLLTTCS
jgi:hypothetical protein